LPDQAPHEFTWVVRNTSADFSASCRHLRLQSPILGRRPWAPSSVFRIPMLRPTTRPSRSRGHIPIDGPFPSYQALPWEALSLHTTPPDSMAVINFQIDLGWRLPVCRRIGRAEMASADMVINCDPMDTGDPEASPLRRVVCGHRGQGVHSSEYLSPCKRGFGYAPRVCVD